jgi:RNA polymerase sigma-70 factor (ECF subfamily)
LEVSYAVVSVLLDSFTARLAVELPGDHATVASALADLYARGRVSWPGLEVGEATFGACVAARIRNPGEIAAQIAGLPADDVYLASACAAGESAAIARFEDRYFPGARDALRRMARDPSDIDDILQRVRQRLFVCPPGDVPGVCALVGGGDLGALVRIAAVRLALNAQRDDRRTPGDPEPLLAQLALDLDPRDELVSVQARRLVEDALTEALAGLAPRDRTLLKLHLVHGLTIDELGATFHVHRSTAARWIARIREDLEAATLERLGHRLAASQDDLASLVRLVRDRLEISFSRLLATPPPA